MTFFDYPSAYYNVPVLQRDLVSSHFDSGRSTEEEGVEDAFEVLHENDERVRTGIWVGDCFIYNNASWKLNYCVGGEVLCISLSYSNLTIVMNKV